MKKSFDLTVNREAHRVEATPRTQLAEILRDTLHLTGTHLGCEQGVCGACTVLVDGQPTRSCITFAGSCDGAAVETVEGFMGDDLMDRLRVAFSKHHALQCGFCTPGMIITARDIVSRFDAPDEARIRHELSGNLCRCTGYVGIVAAIADVIAQRNALGKTAATPAPPLPGHKRGFVPFDAKSTPRPASDKRVQAPRGSVSIDGDWTVVSRRFDLPHRQEAVWNHFRDLRAVGACFPGAVITEVDETGFAGLVEVKFGLIRARFEGKGSYRNEDTDRKGTVDGRGQDSGRQSNLRAQLVYRILPGRDAAGTTVDLDFRFQIQGMLAQFNRPDLVADLVDFILGQFVKNCDDVLSGRAITAGRRLSAFALITAILRSRLKAFFQRR
jgi:carbon-monoxide dehydrogenase small subunit